MRRRPSRPGRWSRSHVWALLVDGKFGPGLRRRAFRSRCNTGDVRVASGGAVHARARSGLRPLLDVSDDEAGAVGRASSWAVLRGQSAASASRGCPSRASTSAPRSSSGSYRWRGEPDRPTSRPSTRTFVSAAEHGMNARVHAGSSPRTAPTVAAMSGPSGAMSAPARRPPARVLPMIERSRHRNPASSATSSTGTTGMGFGHASTGRGPPPACYAHLQGLKRPVRRPGPGAGGAGRVASGVRRAIGRTSSSGRRHPRFAEVPHNDAAMFTCAAPGGAANHGAEAHRSLVGRPPATSPGPPNLRRRRWPTSPTHNSEK